MCGEKKMKKKPAGSLAGSPPHVRGKDALFVGITKQHRITPACAGKRINLDRFGGVTKDHPRMCGEKLFGQLDRTGVPGSPPHVRGKVFGQVLSALVLGITPACAGKRLKRSRSTVPPVAIVPLFPSVCNKPVVSDGSPAGRDAPLFLPAENAVPASPAYNLRSL